MICINNSNTDPYFNLASEEYMLENFTEDCFMLWINKPALIVGRNQNTLSEINIDYAKKENLCVVRRLSGGGATFHDLGNLNFTFIANNQLSDFTNFKKFAQPIIDVLQNLSVNAEFSGRNDLTIEGKKFSGNAQCKYKNKILHHGSLLFSCDLQHLNNALNVDPAKFQDKSVKSVSSRVTNISDYLKSPLYISDFSEIIMQHILETNTECKLYKFNAYDIKKINELAQNKYSTWEWNFGKSPKYNLKKKKKYKFGLVEFNLDVKNGVINNAKFFGDFFGKYDIGHIETALIGVNHTPEDIRKVLSSFNINDYFSNISIDDLLEGLF
ncbi:lipoate--protein ligase [Clostridium culturomicium]|uniref:lipoate--protein ligase n=1 Tax=Clostridium culturomicium TaxID=1499683 RepID=UPI0038577745